MRWVTAEELASYGIRQAVEQLKKVLP